MNLLFWTSSKPRRLTDALRGNLVSQFHLGAESLEKLRFVGKNGKYAGRGVQFVRIFDPSLIASGGAAILKYQDLQEAANRGPLRFEGHIERDGPVHLTDRRQPVADGRAQDSN